MKNVFIMYAGVNAAKSAKVHGGGVYARWITKELKSELLREPRSVKLSVIWPKGVLPKTDEENEIYNDPFFHVEESDSLEKVDFKPGDTLFIPVMESTKINYKNLKRKFPMLYIIAVIHGFRNHDLLRYEKYQKYYHEWYKQIPGIGILSFVRQVRAFLRERENICSACKYVDYVVTDSNNSMQLIIRYGKPNKICFYHPASLNRVFEEKDIEYRYDENYMMLINANRNEKNCLRTLAAFCKYKAVNPEDKLKFYIIGMTDSLKKRLKYVPGIDSETVEKDVVFFGYVSSKQLSDIYRQCSFVIYPSKSEGYGLPLLDALMCDKPVVASRITSVPEVLGSAAYYIDPFSTDSIYNGISFMSKEKNLKKYQDVLQMIKPMVQMRYTVDTKILVKKILEDGYSQ